MKIALTTYMSSSPSNSLHSVDSLHAAAPSLKRHRSRSTTDALQRRRQLAQRKQRRDISRSSSQAIVTPYFEHPSTINSVEPVSSRTGLILSVLFALSGLLALASLAVG